MKDTKKDFIYTPVDRGSRAFRLVVYSVIAIGTFLFWYAVIEWVC